MWWECGECGHRLTRQRPPAVCRECGRAGAVFVPAEPDVDGGVEVSTPRGYWLQAGLQSRRFRRQLAAMSARRRSM